MRTGDTSIFTFYLPTKVIHGPHSAQETGKEFKTLGATKAFVVTDKGVKNAGLLDGVLESLTRSAVPYIVFDEVEEDPGEATVGKGAEVVSREKCDGIVVVGGGSPICAARGVGVVATNGGKIRDYAGFHLAAKPPLPLIAIPTTAGSGTEVSQFILLKDEVLHTKIVAGSPWFFPKVAILDPLLLKGLPFHQFVASGVDALGHAIEAYLTSQCTPITDAWALQAVGLMYHNLRPAAMTNDLDAKEACLIGSSLANMACGNARLGLVHAMASPVEAAYKVPHGLNVGILLPKVMEFNLPAAYNRFADLARIMGEDSSRGDSMEAAASRAIAAVKRLLSDLDFPRKYSESQVDHKAIPHFAKILMAGQFGVYDPDQEYPISAQIPTFNIRKATLGDVIMLYEKSFEGWE